MARGGLNTGITAALLLTVVVVVLDSGTLVAQAAGRRWNTGGHCRGNTRHCGVAGATPGWAKEARKVAAGGW
ncbi:MAG: hypothetical protein IPI55_16805 [Flavobacteriales bacterium]|nr:hypothetical protein [Flavobacteriales bacterium]